jgi:serine/threonine protein kinase
MSTLREDDAGDAVLAADTVLSTGGALGTGRLRADEGRPAERSAEAPSPPPVHIGRYEIRSVLGRGGMGCVHRAFDPVLEREVALKVMRAEIVGDPEQKQRFEREARAVARLSHPAVVTVFDLGYHTDGSPYIVMELLRGQDLLARMRQGPPLTLEEKTSIVGQVLDGLGHAHRAGIVHRDIKPANVFLTEDGLARIMDFGLAFFTASGATSQTLMGTVSYMSSEQVRGERPDGRSDLFSVGTLLCEMLSGRRPFEGETPAATLYRIAHDEPQIELPTGQQAFLPVLGRALAKKVDERYQTAADFATALRACLDRTRTSDAKRVAVPVVEGSAAPPPAPSAAGRAPSPAASPSAPSAVPSAIPSPSSSRKADPSGLFKLLREVYVGERTGQLHFTVGAQRKSLRILKGRILHGTSDVNGEHLGDVLVRYGLLGQTDLEGAVEVVLRERKRLGAVLAATGLLEREALAEAVGIHVREILFSALDGADVTFSFEDLAEEALETDLACPQSMGQVILEATRRVFDPALVRRVLGDTSRTLELSPHPLLRTQKITLTPADGFVLSRIDGTLSARGVMDLSPLPAEDTERSLFSLLCTGIVGYREQATARTTTLHAPRRAPAAAPVTPPPSPVPSRPPAEAPAPPRAVAPPPVAKPTAPVTARPPSVPKPAPPPVAPPAAPTPSASPSLAEIRAILEASTRRRRDPFEVLGLEPTADDAEIRAAYARLARVLHPDAVLDPSLDDVRGMRQAAFVQLGQAVETLRSPGFRQYAAEKAARVRARATPTAAPSPIVAAAPRSEAAPVPRPAPAPDEPRPRAVDPEELLGTAREHFEAARYWDAIQLLEPFLPQARGAIRVQVRLLLAQTYFKNPRWSKRAETIALELVRESPQLAPAHLLLAEIYRASGMATRAKAAYQKVLTLQPGNEAATNGLAELDPPKESRKQGGLRGIFQKR